MKESPCAKINLGLNVVARRSDGYHDLETVFFPVPLCDELSVTLADTKKETACELVVDGNTLDCDSDDNLVAKAYRLLAQTHSLPAVEAQLAKRIPSQAGLGGGSSDAAFMLKVVNALCNLQLTDEELRQRAATLGADCAFFIDAQPAFAEGIGERLAPLPDLSERLKGLWILIVKPPVAVSTREAFSLIVPARPSVCCREAVMQPIEQWAALLSNDFEKSVFAIHPMLADMKDWLYRQGAVYAQMSGSGSALFGLFKEKPVVAAEDFPDCFFFTAQL